MTSKKEGITVVSSLRKMGENKMWLLVYTSDQAKKVEPLISAMNSGDYRGCGNVVYGEITDKLKKAGKDNVRYMELENDKEKARVIKNWHQETFPVLLLMSDNKNETKEILEVYEEEDIFVGDFSF